VSKVSFYQITQTQYDALSRKEADTLYFITDSHRLFQGGSELSPGGGYAPPGVTFRIPAEETRFNLFALGAVDTTWNGEFQVYGKVFGCYCLGATINVRDSGEVYHAIVTYKADGQGNWEGGLQLSDNSHTEHVVVEGGHLYLTDNSSGYDIEVRSGGRLMISGDNAVGRKILLRSGARLQLYNGSALEVTAETGSTVSVSDGTTITYA